MHSYYFAGPGFVHHKIMDENKAATTIQAYIRGHLARKLYAQELFKLFEKVAILYV